MADMQEDPDVNVTREATLNDQSEESYACMSSYGREGNISGTSTRSVAQQSEALESSRSLRGKASPLPR
jgi:hypothetical protein